MAATRRYLQSDPRFCHVHNRSTRVGLILGLRPGFFYDDFADYCPEAPNDVPAGFHACAPTGNFGPVVTLREPV